MEWLVVHSSEWKKTSRICFYNKSALFVTYIQVDRTIRTNAAFCIERAIGELKWHVHSVRDAGVNSGNVIVEIGRYSKKKQASATRREKKKTIAVSTLPNSPELWGPFSQKSTSDMKCAAQLKNFWAINQNTYIIIDQNQLLETGRWLWQKSTVYGSQNHSFIRIITKVNSDLSWSDSVRPEKRQYFGFIWHMFAYKYSSCRKLLAVVDVAELVENHTLWPYRTRSAWLKWCVIQVNNIVGFTGRVVGKNGHEYVFWSQLESYKKEPPIDYKLKYLM